MYADLGTGSLLLKNLIVFLWASLQHVFLFIVAKQKSWTWIWSAWKTWKMFDQGCLPFAWKNQKFRWENQMVCAISFGKLQKMWLSSGVTSVVPGLWSEGMKLFFSFQSVQLIWIYFVAALSPTKSNSIVLCLCRRFPPRWFV